MADRRTIACIANARDASLASRDFATAKPSSPEYVVVGLLEAVYWTNLAILGCLARDVEVGDEIDRALGDADESGKT